MKSLKQTIMARDELTSAEADALIAEARTELASLIDEGGDILEAEELMYDFFSLEPDYLMDLI